MVGVVEPADLLRTARRRRGLTQADVATRAGTSQPVVSAYERGRRDPTVGTLRRLIAATGAHLDLRLATPPPTISPPATAADHGHRLVDVLLLADAVGHGRRGPLTFPRIDST